MSYINQNYSRFSLIILRKIIAISSVLPIDAADSCAQVFMCGKSENSISFGPVAPPIFFYPHVNAKL